MLSFRILDEAKGCLANLFGIVFIGFMLMWGCMAVYHAWNHDHIATYTCDADTLTAAEMAALFREHWNEVHFSRLATIDEDAAAVVAASGNWYLSFDAVTDLTPNAELALARSPHRLAFPALRQIKTPALAATLAKGHGELKLDGLTQLAPEIAAELARHDGNVSLNGVRDLSFEAADALCKHCSMIIDRRARRVGRIVIPFEQRVSVAVSLLGLESPSPDVRNRLIAGGIVLKPDREANSGFLQNGLPDADSPSVATPLPTGSSGAP